MRIQDRETGRSPLALSGISLDELRARHLDAEAAHTLVLERFVDFVTKNAIPPDLAYLLLDPPARLSLAGSK